MSDRRTHADSALIEDLQATLLGILIEIDLHRGYQAEILAQLPNDTRAHLTSERDITDRYIRHAARTGLDMLSEARPGPYAYDPERCADRLRPARMLEVMG